jgi:hypothetical protein
LREGFGQNWLRSSGVIGIIVSRPTSDSLKDSKIVPAKLNKNSVKLKQAKKYKIVFLKYKNP